MSKIAEFISLQPDEGVLQRLRNAFAVFGLYTLWAFIVYHILDFMTADSSTLSQLFLPMHLPGLRETAFKLCFIAPFVEEALFRAIPIQLCRAFKFDLKITWLIILGVSIIFGLGHGSGFCVFAQGILGILLSFLYIKSNSYLLNVFTHSLWNFSCLLAFQYLAQ